MPSPFSLAPHQILFSKVTAQDRPFRPPLPGDSPTHQGSFSEELSPCSTDGGSPGASHPNSEPLALYTSAFCLLSPVPLLEKEPGREGKGQGRRAGWLGLVVQRRC